MSLLFRTAELITLPFVLAQCVASISVHKGDFLEVLKMSISHGTEWLTGISGFWFQTERQNFMKFAFQKQIFLVSCGLQGMYGIYTECALQNLLSYFQQSVKKSHE